MLYCIFRWQKVDVVSQCFSETFHGYINIQVVCNKLNTNSYFLSLIFPLISYIYVVQIPSHWFHKTLKIILVLICYYILMSVCKALQNIIQSTDSKCFPPKIAWSGLAVQSLLFHCLSINWDLDVASAGGLTMCLPF